MIESARHSLGRALNGTERLWKIWICAIPVVLMATALTGLAETVRIAGAHGWGDFFDVVKLLFYFFWFRLAWRCSRNVDAGVWTPLSHLAASTGLVLVVLI